MIEADVRHPELSRGRLPRHSRNCCQAVKKQPISRNVLLRHSPRKTQKKMFLSTTLENKDRFGVASNGILPAFPNTFCFRILSNEVLIGLGGGGPDTAFSREEPERGKYFGVLHTRRTAIIAYLYLKGNTELRWFDIIFGIPTPDLP